jgi:trehalose 6-phosphate phosphatase
VTLPDQLLPIVREAARSALFLDFDGTLSAIVADPVGARPLPGVPDLLRRLARRVGLVAVISGRPRTFLAEALEAPAGVQLVGLYGLELALEGEEGERWAREMADVVMEATAERPEGCYVEPKGLTVTLHWRQAPEVQGWIERFAARQHERRGLSIYPARSSLELRPSVDVDKGTVLRTLVGRMEPSPRVLAAFGDDVGDLPAFAAAAALAEEMPGLSVVRVAAVDDESPPEVAAQADLTVAGATGAAALLEDLAEVLNQSPD